MCVDFFIYFKTSLGAGRFNKNGQFHLWDIPAGIVVVIYIVLDWTSVLMNATTMIPCRRVSERQLAIAI